MTTPTLHLNLLDHTARKNGEPVHLTPTEWRMVETLTRRPGALVRQDELLRAVWGPSYENRSHYLRVYVCGE
ncbi:MAG TPA: winged helix-turn-helix domain-containing protein [Microlunatus sp.]